MVKKCFSIWLPALFLCLTAIEAHAQNPCTDSVYKKGLRRGEQYTSPCDSMVVLNRKSYERDYQRIAYYEELVKLQSQYMTTANEALRLRDSARTELRSIISAQDNALLSYRSFISRSDSLVTRSTKNTDRALDELDASFWRTLLTGVGAAAVGFIVGVLVTK